MSIPGGSKRNFEEKEDTNDIHREPVSDPVVSESPHPGLKRRDSLDIEADKFLDNNDTEVSISFHTYWLIVSISIDLNFLELINIDINVCDRRIGEWYWH